MTTFVDACVEAAAGSAQRVTRKAGRPKVRKLLRVLASRRNILITTHLHPDPDAIASSMGLAELLRRRLKDARVTIAFKGAVGGGVNEAFTRYADFHSDAWDDAALAKYDAIILLDTQPDFGFSPLPATLQPTAVIDHHRSPRRKPQVDFVDIRNDVGATASIIFSYYLEADVEIPRDLAAALLFAIESDLAGAAGTPGSLDNLALSNLTLRADTRKLYQMRYVDLPRSYYVAYASALSSAICHDCVITAHLDQIDSLEKPAVFADFLLRFDQAEWALVTGVHQGRLMLSLRTKSSRLSAGQMMRRMVRRLGAGGGHLNKAGGFVPLNAGSAAEIERVRGALRSRLLRALKIRPSRGQKLI